MKISSLIDVSQIAIDEEEAVKLIESFVWPDGIPVCPHCKSKGAYKLTAKPQSKTGVRPFTWKCKSTNCRKQFTVRYGTVFQDSRLPLGKWLIAMHLLCASKKSMSAHQLHRLLDISYSAAWHMAHRIRYAMENSIFVKLDGIVEGDESYIGGLPKRGDGIVHKRGRGTDKPIVMAVVERHGKVRTQVVPDVTAKTLKAVIRTYVEKTAELMTDQHHSYRGLGNEFASHETVNHGRREYARGRVNTNTIEGFFGLFKRSLKGSWHRISREHLQRYLREAEFRWNRKGKKDAELTMELLQMVKGKKLSYQELTSHEEETVKPTKKGRST